MTLTVTDHHALSLAVQAVNNSLPFLLTHSIHQHLVYKDLTGDCVKGLPEAQADNIHYSPLIYQAGHVIVEVQQVDTR